MDPSALHIRLSGRMSISSTSATVGGSELPGRQGRLIFARLALDSGPVGRDDLADVLWPDTLPKSWERDLSAVVSKIRAVLGRLGAGPRVLPGGGGSYDLRLPEGSTVDVLRARAAVAAGESAASEERPVDRAELLAATETLRAVFLPGESSAWVDAVRDECRRFLLRALDLQAAVAGGRGELADAMAAAEEALAVDPYRETAYVALMRLHLQHGDRTGALRTFDRCRRVLAEDLGVEPAASTMLAARDLAHSETAGVVPLPAALATRDRAFVGRAPELSILTGAWKRARAGDRQVVVIGGEAGIGKTRLAAVAAERAWTDGSTVAYGRCDQDPVVPFQPVVEAVRELARSAAPGMQRALGPAAQVLASLVPELATGESREKPDVDSTHDRLRLFDALTTALASGGPGTVAVFDDLQWATESTLLLVRHVVRHAGPTLIVCTYRDSEVSFGVAELLTWLDREPDVHHLVLDGLDRDEVAELMVGASPDRGEVASMHATTAGNPFFLTELLKQGEAGVAAGVPRAVRAMVAQRVAALGADAADALLAGALVGRRFPVDVIERAVGSDDLTAVVDAAVRQRLLADTDCPADVMFKHDIVREAVLAGVSTVRRQRMHESLAEAFETVTPNRVEDIFRHLEAGGATDPARMASYALRAGTGAMSRFAWEDAIPYLEAGLAAVEAGGPADEPLAVDLLLALGRVRLVLGEREGARTAAVAAADRARRARLPDRIARAAALLYGRGAVVGEPDPVLVTACDDALEALPEEATALRAEVTAMLGEHRCSAEGDADSGRRLVDEALRLARTSGDVDALTTALWAAVVTLNASPDLDRVAALVDEMFSLAGDMTVFQRADALFMRERLELVRGDRQKAENAARSLASMHAEHRLWTAGWQGTQWASVRAQLDGDFDAAAEHLDVMRRVYAPADPNAANLCVGHEALIALERGDLDHVVAVALAAVEFAPGVPAFRALLAIALARSGATAAAAGHLDDLVRDGTAAIPEDVTWVSALVMLAEVAGHCRAPGAATVLYGQLEPFAGSTAVVAATVACIGAVDRYLGILAAVIGDQPRAAEHFRAAVALEEALASAPLLARTRYWWARTLIDRGDPLDVAVATELIDDAARVADRLGMAELAAACRHDRRHAGVRTPLNDHHNAPPPGATGCSVWADTNTSVSGSA